MKTWTKKLQKLQACQEAVDWCQAYDSLEQAWAACKRGDWMLWLCGRLSGPPESDSRKKLVLVACQCVRLGYWGLPYVQKGETRPLKVIETTEAWARGEVAISEVREAADAAYAAHAADAAHVASYAAYVADAADAAHVASYAAYVAADAAHVASYAAYVAADAAHAAYAAHAADAADAAHDAAQTTKLNECADIVREHYDPPTL